LALDAHEPAVGLATASSVRAALDAGADSYVLKSDLGRHLAAMPRCAPVVAADANGQLSSLGRVITQACGPPGCQ
jgi:hypothetical protein